MKNLSKILSIAILCFTMQLTTPTVVEAQCPMCKMGAESNLKNGGSHGKGLNAGILFLLSMPYIMVGTIGYVWYRNRKREEELLD